MYDEATKKIRIIEHEIRLYGVNQEAMRYFNTSADRWMEQCKKQQETLQWERIALDIPAVS